MDRMYVDTETCGLHGVPVTLQYAINDGPVIIHEFWREPIQKSMDLIKRYTECQVIGFNLVFDHFHIQKMYNILEKLVEDMESPWEPPTIKAAAAVEKRARDGSCVKPAGALDLMLHFRKTELQITMERQDVKIRRVPRALADDLAKLLNKKLKLDPILFAGYKKLTPRFKIRDIEKEDGTVDRQLVNIDLKFRPSSALKMLAKHILKEEDIVVFADVEVDKVFRPKEHGYAPYHEVVKEDWKKKKYAWPRVIQTHIDHWAFRPDARKYAEKDVEYTRRLHQHTGMVAGNDTNSLLTCLVASCRWKGYRLDLDKLSKLIDKYRAMLNVPIAPNKVKKHVHRHLNEIEQSIILAQAGKGTGKKQLQAIIDCLDDDHPAVIAAKEVMAARKAKKKIEVLEKLLLAGRFHPSAKVMGTLSDRMSGADGLNFQGIDKTKEIRECFPLAFEDENLTGGDMISFEIGIADAVYNDPKLREQLMTCEACRIQCQIIDGRPRCHKCGGIDMMKFHGLFGMQFFTDMTYEQIKATSKTEDDKYNKSKTAAFATLYGAQPQKLKDTLEVSMELAQEGFDRFWRVFKGAGAARRKVENDFSAIVQNEKGQIEYKEPKDYIESLLGHPRYFSLENYIIKELFELANNPPRAWTRSKLRIVRSKKGEQSVSGALRSAVYGAAFATQNSNIRQAANHQIQSTGAGITKQVQVCIWEFQPVGIHKWVVRPLNIHDEIQCPTKPGIEDELIKAVQDKVETFRPIVPLIGIDYLRLNTWADK